MKVLYIIIGLTCLSYLVSCKKPVKGCTDEKALNFNWQAEENDGTCTYEVRGVFYHKEPFSQNLIDNGVTEINYYLDGELIGSKLPFNHWSFIPDCGSTEAIGFTRNIGTSKFVSYNYILRDQNGFSLDQGNVTINGGDCVAIENQ
ncbi:MAG: hypothetical protein ACWA41_02790 [Putridiphycobacter sp.]